MRRHLGWTGAAALLVVGVALLSGCGGTGGGGGTSSTDAEPAPRTPQFVLDPVGTTSNAGSLTMGVSKAGLDGNLADRITVFARLLDPQRLPLVGVNVGFAADFPGASFVPGSTPPDGVAQDGFPSGAAITDGNGVAQITLVAPSETGRMAIVAQTARNLRLSGLIFVDVYDVGFIPSEGDVPVLIPTEITVSDPSVGSQLQFVIVGGIPFTDEDPPLTAASLEPETGFILADPAQPAATAPPYILENAESGVGVAELIFNGRFPATILYTLSGRVAGAHSFGIIDARGSAISGTVTVEFTALEISPELATIEVGSSQSFALTGGVPPYVCTPSGGTLTPTTIFERGGTTRFLPDAIVREASFTILCRDEGGQTVTADVSIIPLPSPSPGSGDVPAEAARVELWGNPPTLNGPDGGISVIVARVLDQDFAPLPGVPVFFSLEGQTEEPPPTLPSISPTTGVSDGEGLVLSNLTVPAGTAPQFLIISVETNNGMTASTQIAITSQRVEPAGPPARISAAVLREDACQLNQDGTLTAIISALVSDDEGNPVDSGVEVEWSDARPQGASDVVGASFTNGEVPCTVDQYRTPCEDSGIPLTISPQPGTATTCFTYELGQAGNQARVTATVRDNTSISTETSFRLPAPAPEPTPAPTPVPVPTSTPLPPVLSLVPPFATLNVGDSQVFAIVGGEPPFAINASGGSANQTAERTFVYTATTPGPFDIVVTDSGNQAVNAPITNISGSVIGVSQEGPLTISKSSSVDISITGGGVPPYQISLIGLPGVIIGSTLSAPGTFTYDPVNTAGQGQILIQDSDSPPNERSIVVTVTN